jgi:hypothetical protein
MQATPHSLTKSQVLIYISTNAIHFNELPPHYLSVASSRIAMTRTLQDLAVNTPVSEMQILTVVSEEIASEEKLQFSYL